MALRNDILSRLFSSSPRHQAVRGQIRDLGSRLPLRPIPLLQLTPAHGQMRRVASLQQGFCTQLNSGFPTDPLQEAGDVVQLVRTLLSHRHNDVSDLKISNLVQPTSVRPVTVSAISLHFRKLVVRFLEVPDVFLVRDRSASRMANKFFVKN